MPATFATDGALNTFQGGNDIGGASTGIGVASNQSGPLSTQIQFSVTAADFVAPHIGDGALATSASNTGPIVQEPPTITAGSGYTNGTYYVESTGGGQGNGASSLFFTVAGGIITASRVKRPGSGFTSAPTFTVANALNTDGTGTGPGAGTGGALVVTVGLDSRAVMLGAAFGVNKGTRRLQAAASVANGAAISGGYLNRSGRTMAIGDQTWAVAP